MRTKTRTAKSKLTEKQLLADAKKALRQTKHVLNAELKKVDSYLKALDGHNSFNL
jgi:hypothetical protein